MGIRVEKFKDYKIWWLLAGLLFVKSIILACLVYPEPFPKSLAVFQYVVLYLPFIFLVMSVLFLFNGKNGYRVIYYLSLLISAFYLGDSLYYRAFSTPLTLYTFGQGVCLDDLWSGIFSLVRPVDLLFIIDLPFLSYYISRHQLKAKKNKKLFVKMFGFSLFLCLVLLFGMKLSSLPAYAIVDRVSPIGYHLNDLKSYFSDRNFTLSDKDRVKIENWLTQNRIQNSELTSVLHGVFQGKNLIIVQFESLEQSVIKLSVEGQEITPNLNRLLEHSYYFPNIYPQVADGSSSDAELMLTTSLYPLKRGALFFRYPDNTYPSSLPALLQDQGYSNFAIHGDNAAYWNRNVVYPKLGFQKFIGEEELNNADSISMGISDRSTFLQTVDLLTKQPEPYLAFIITLTSHMPFTIPDSKKGLTIEKKINRHLEAYYQSMNYADRALSDFIHALTQKGMLEDSVIVIYGDHDSYHRYYDKTGDVNDNRIPFIIYNPSVDAQVFKQCGGQIDFFPTLADLMGIPANEYSGSIMGKNLLTQKEGYAVLKGGEYVGDTKDQEHNLEGPEIADLMIKSNFLVLGE